MTHRSLFLLSSAVAATLAAAPAALAQGAVNVPLLIQESLTDDPTQPDFQLLPGVARTDEPVTLGLPLPASAGVCDTNQLGISGGALVGQFRVLRRWATTSCGGQGSVQWVLVDTQANVTAGGQTLSLSVTGGTGNFGGAALATDQGATIRVDTGPAQFTIRKQGFNLFDSVTVGGVGLVSPGASPGIELIGEDGTAYRSSSDSGSQVSIEENGPARAVIVARGVHRSAGGARNLEFTVRMHFYRGRTRARVIYTLRNASTQQVANTPFRSLELVVATNLTSPAFTARQHAGETTGTLGPADVLSVFQGENAFPNDRDWDFTDFDANGNEIKTKWPTTIEGYTIGRNGATLASGTRDNLIDLSWAQARGGSGATVTIGTRFAAGWWPQGLRIAGDGRVRVGLFPVGNDKPYYSRFTGHVTREVLFDFATSAPSGDDLMTRFQYPLVGKAQEVDWYNRSGAIWEKLLSFDEERAFYQSRGLPTTYPDDWRPDFFITRHYYWGRGGGRNQYDQAKVSAYNFLRDDAPWAGGYYAHAAEKFLYNADLAIYHSDDFDGARGDIPSFNDLPNIQVVPAAKAVFESEHLHAYGLPLWYTLTGDERIREAYTDWGEHLHHFRPLGYNPWERGLIWNIFNLVDVYRFTGDTRHRDLAWQLFQGEILNKTAIHRVSEGTDWQRGFYASLAATFDVGGTNQPRDNRFLASFIMGGIFPRAYAYIHDFLPADELQADRARDVLEGMVRFIYREHWFEFSQNVCDYGYSYYQSLDSVPPDPRSDGNWICGHKEVWPALYWGYVLTGDNEFLRQADQLMAILQTPGITGEFQDWPDRQTLEHLQLHPERHDRWQDLPVTVQNNGGGSYTLTWTVPDGAKRYWMKYSNRTIVPWLNFDRNTRQFQFDPSQYIPFFAAQNAVGEPAPAAVGTTQSFTITGLDPQQTTSFSARVLIGAATAVFADVPVGYWARPWIEALYRAGVTRGCGTNPLVYCPATSVNRAQMAAFLLRAREGSTYTPPPATGIFADVDPASQFAPWIEELYGRGITTGCAVNPLRYCPTSSVTRGQMAPFLLRTFETPGYSPPPATGIFTDVGPGSQFAPWIEELYRRGITTGCATNPLRYCPTSSVTRAQMAVFLVRTFSLPL